MRSHDDIQELQRKQICFKCVADAVLSRETQTNGSAGTCSFCADNDPCYDLETMSDRVATAFEQHYDRTSDQPTSMQYAVLKDKGSDYEWDREGEPVDDAIAAAGMPQEAAMDIRQILAERFSDWDAAMSGQETEFDGDSYYERKDVRGGRWNQEWASFEHALKTEARFFSRDAMRHLAELFDGIDKITARRRISVGVG